MINVDLDGRYFEANLDGEVLSESLNVSVSAANTEANADLMGRYLESDLDGMTTTVPLNVEINLGTRMAGPGDIVHINTTAYWDSLRDFTGKRGHLYVYTDHDTVDGVDIPAVKAADGLAYLIDIPFITDNASILMNHINNNEIHITQYEREFWNNKVRCDESQVVLGENLILTTH